MASAHAVSEGYMPFRGFRTWYRVVGDPGWDAERAPVMVLHGGPGATHDYLEDLARLADGRRRVILYDQLGAGNSDHPHDPSLWTVARRSACRAGPNYCSNPLLVRGRAATS